MPADSHRKPSVAGQCPRPAPRRLADHPSRPLDDRPMPPILDNPNSNNNNNNNSNSMTNRMRSVIVSDTGPPPLPAVARRRWTGLAAVAVVQCFCSSDRFRKSVQLPMVLLLLVMLSALPNSCTSAASIQQQQLQPASTLAVGRSSRAGQHNRHHPTTTTSRSVVPSNRLLTECPWLEWEPNNSGLSVSESSVQHHQADMAGTRAYMAPVVFEGKARSRSDGPVYRVTFDVVTVYKGEVALTGSQVRLEFKSGTTTATTTTAAANSKSLRSLSHNSATGRSRTLSAGRRISASSGGAGQSPVRRRQPGQGQQPHHHRHQHHNTRECLVTAEIRTGRRYLVFAAHWGPNNFTAFGSPLVHTKKSLKDVRSTLCPRCARSPVAYGLEDSVTVKKQQKLILRCRTRGNPVPGVVWYKDGKPLNAASKRVRIKTKRRRSTLRIRCVKEEDAGLYECRPSNVIGTGTASRSKVTVVKVTAGPSSSSSSSSLSDPSSSSKLSGSLRPSNGSSSSSSSSLWPLIALPCPIDSFCLNGGTCKYYEAVGELVCQCAEGYKGQRCENKDIYNLGTDTLGGVEADMRTLALYLGK
ncbi:uncharacterized protein LOC124201689 isoform X2 [Daphnia pulex]|uniref:uncharacterized protein LOC124201689 isoform X2 n=1 Tax=Daphnia pulex TaxID=6669 RepID=UPI001EDCA52C|nr:uncharacterized protein LOC124201689 isoform X2 [Daphnia pulex]